MTQIHSTDEIRERERDGVSVTVFLLPEKEYKHLMLTEEGLTR